MIIGLLTYVLNIPIRGIFGRTLNHQEIIVLSDPTHVMSMADPMANPLAIGVH